VDLHLDTITPHQQLFLSGIGGWDMCLEHTLVQTLSRLYQSESPARTCSAVSFIDIDWKLLMKIPARQLQTPQQLRVIKQPSCHQMHQVVSLLDNAMHAQQL
jgi:hypothetical protein